MDGENVYQDSKYFLRNKLRSFIRVTFIKSKLWPILFQCVTSKFKRLSRHGSHVRRSGLLDFWAFI